MHKTELSIKPETAELLAYYAHRLNRSKEAILDEALRRYFVQVEEELVAEEERAMTTFDFDEFYDGLDIG